MELSFRDQYQRSRRYFINLGKITQKRQVKSFAWLSLSILTIAFFGLVAIRPTLITIAKLRREINDKREASQKLQEKINSLVEAQNVYAKNVSYLPLLDEALPEKNQFPQVASYLEQIASSSGVRLSILSLEKVEVALDNDDKKSDTSKQNSFNFTTGATGDYQSLKTFLKDIESSRRIMLLKTTSMNTSEKEEVLELSIIVTGQIYFGGNQN